MAKLKVFTWSDGFHAYTVAASSRAKALAAWGVARDLFKDGDAKEIHEGPDVVAALAAPGETIKRGLSVDIGKSAPVAKPKAPKKADLERVAALERELATLRERHEADSRKIEDERRRIDERAATLESAFADQSQAIETRLEAARRKVDRWGVDFGGRGWDRTSDILRVKQALSR